MSGTTTIFVSHSSQDRALTEAAVAELEQPYVDAQGRNCPGFRVLVDFEELKPGVEWPRRLHVMMAKCHAALILLTEAAVKSPWVLKESTILTWRRTLATSDTFKCIPFVDPAVNEQQLQAHGFGPLALADIQWGRALDAGTIASSFRQLLPQRMAKSLFDELVGRLSDHLKSAGENTLDDVACRLRVDSPPWRGSDDAETDFVADVAAAILMGHLGDYDGVDALIDDLAQGTARPDTLRMILKWAAPAWIDLETAGRLRILAAQPERRCLGINGRHVHVYTANMLASRAYPLTDRFRLIPTAGGDAGNVADHVTREICERLRTKGEFHGTDAEIISALTKVSAPYCVVLGPPVPDDGSLTELRARFPKLSFLLCTGDMLDVDPHLSNVEWLKEDLSLDREEEEYVRFREAEALVKRRAANWS